MRRKTIYLLLLLLLGAVWVSSAVTNKSASKQLLTLLTTQQHFVASQKLTLCFEANTHSIPLLFLHQSIVPTLVEGNRVGSKITYIIPPSISRKTGVVDWKLVANREVLLSGAFEITPDTVLKKSIDSYFGPRSIQAGGGDFSMMVVVPTDSFDNPLPTETPVLISCQFQQSIKTQEVKSAHFVSFLRLYSPLKSGRMLVSAHCNGTPSMELTTIVYPFNATDFTINASRNHEFADGNQITTLFTSTIKDQYDNCVSDGTVVFFNITDDDGNQLQTTGVTIAGVATSQLLHPRYPIERSISAVVVGIAKSNTLTLTYQSVLTEYNYTLSTNNRQIEVGPLLSFMKQLIPDGSIVELSLYSSKREFLETKLQGSLHGFVSFELHPSLYPNGRYFMTLKALGVLKEIGFVDLK